MASDTGGWLPLRRAFFSVSDRSGLVELARALASRRVEIVATKGTRGTLEKEGIPTRAAEELTGIGDWFGGRIKTLHPGLLGGILSPRTEEGAKELAERGLLPIDLVVVNFYPFARHLVEHPGATDREEFIDVGGITLARAAAKNHAFVTVATDPTDYPQIEAELRSTSGKISITTRRTLAARAFARCSDYDATIAAALDGVPPGEAFPSTLRFVREPVRLRYGENPHQNAAIYGLSGVGHESMAPQPFRVVKGESLSYTNLLDLETVLAIVAEFPTPTAAVVKHATPCGVASGTTVGEALALAVSTDPVARYGCVIAVNRPLAGHDLDGLAGVFVDLLAAPEVGPETLGRLEKRRKLKVVTTPVRSLDEESWQVQNALGRLLVQEHDRRQLAPNEFKLVTGPGATPQQACALDFAWRVVRHAKSNAIVLADGSKTVGIGCGQPTRVKAVEIACEVAGDRANGSVLASDAFFPFPDGVEVAGKAGVAAIIQPGGSLRDPDVIAAAQRYGISMYFTGWRVFRH